MTTGIRAVLVDIDGFLTEGVGGRAYPGGPEAIAQIAARFPLRYLTNATSRSRRALALALVREGYPASPEVVITPSALARQVMEQRGDARGVLIADPGAMEDLSWFEPESDPRSARAVLLASESHGRRIGDLGPAVAALRAGARLYTLQQNRVFRRGADLVTDLGPVAAFLGYAADVSWTTFGKPSPLAFQAAAEGLGVPLTALVMAGDDAEFDVAGALRAGVGVGVLARTGKYAAGDEDRVSPRPSHVIASVADLPALLGIGG
ncbi:MAG: HAD hydrolase-like protein [Acidobacteria bacterium]|nr:HAD hydrolase-like protein [Acidobacteriota bacterium]